MIDEEPIMEYEELSFGIKLVNALVSSCFAIFAYYSLSVLIFTESEGLFQQRECWLFCLGLMETLTDPLLFKVAILIFGLSGLFGFLYWQENMFMKLYQKCSKKP